MVALEPSINVIQIESTVNNVLMQPSSNMLDIETIFIWTDYYFLAPAQILPEHKEAGV